MSSMTITSTSASTRGRVVGSHGNYRRTYSDFLALDVALASDDLPSARQAFSRLQNNSPPIAEALSKDPFPAENSRLHSLHDLGRFLLTGDLDGAKQAFHHFNQTRHRTA